MKVKDVMTRRPVTFAVEDDLEHVLRTFAKNSISGCPVIDEKKNVIGLVSQTDVIKAVDVFGKISSGNFSRFVASFVKDKKMDMKKLHRVKVRDFYKKKAITIGHDTDIYQAIKLMNLHDIERVPVVKSRRLVGIVTRTDVIRALGRM